MIDRRSFIKNSALASTSMLIPGFLSNIGYLPEFQQANDKVLVIIQFSGGCDGLNTIVPFTNDIYYRSRPKIGLREKDIIKLNSELAFNKALAPLKRLYDKGLVSIINNVGYPNPVRSHFRSMDIWHTASDSEEVLTTGWLGRYLDAHSNAYHHLLSMDPHLHLAVLGKNQSGFAVGKVGQIKKSAASVEDELFLSENHNTNDYIRYLYKTVTSTASTADYIIEKNKIYRSSEKYPGGPFAAQMKKTAELIISGVETKVFYLSLGSFDTHQSQLGKHAMLLSQFAESLEVMVRDLQKNNRFDDVLIMTFSEFGRRVQENGVNGTDHGTANNMFMISNQLKKPGLFNPGPDLANLDNGDLRFSIDFRQAYATVLEDWLNVSSNAILNRNFNKLGLI